MCCVGSLEDEEKFCFLLDLAFGLSSQERSPFELMGGFRGAILLRDVYHNRC